MQTILVPTDFSPQARNAAFHAAEIAKAFNSRLVLFHAYMLPTPVSEVPYVMVTVDELQSDNEELIRKEAEDLNTRFGVEVEWVVRIGIPSDEIRVLTEDRNVDLVVMGMKGVGGLDKIIGSTTINSIKKISTPVLVIPQDARFQAPRLITLATDLHIGMAAPTLRAFRLVVDAYDSQVQVVHVKKPNHDLTVDLSGWQRQLQDILGRPCTVEIVEDANIQHGINEFVEKHASQLLVMISQKHSFFDRLFGKSQTSSMAYETRIPLLILHQH